jgi:hypothetical protein
VSADEMTTEERVRETGLQRLRREALALGNPFRTYANLLGLIETAVKDEQETHDRMRGLRITMMRKEIAQWEREHPRPVRTSSWTDPGNIADSVEYTDAVVTAEDGFDPRNP